MTADWVVPSDAAGQRLVGQVREHLVVVRRRRVGALIAAGSIEVDGVVGTIDQRMRGGEHLHLVEAALDRSDGTWIVPVDEPLDIVHADDATLVVDKPSGLHVAPTGGHGSDSVLGRLLWHAGARPATPWAPWRPHLVHRLDRAASGLLLVARGATAAAALERDLGRLERTYLARVVGSPATDGGTISAPLGPDPSFDYRRAVVADGQPSTTHWWVVRRDDDTALLGVRLQTGRTHQIRAHLASIGHPIVGDTLYAATGPPTGAAPGALAATDIALRAVSLSFRHPSSGDEVHVDLPPDRREPPGGGH